MSEHKHTAGPWRAERTGNSLQISHDADMGYVIARTIGNGEQDQANARLIAAAPEMLEALKDTASRLEEAACTCVDRSQGHQEGCGGVMMTEPIQAIIAKAEGR